MTTTTTRNSSTRLSVTIVRETPKAFLVEDGEGRQGWIQRRWLRDDQTVSAATLEKASAELEGRKRGQEAERQFRSDSHPVQIERQTEKAIAWKVIFEAANAEREVERLVWAPKSRCQPGEQEGTALVPGWILRSRVYEAREGIEQRYGFGLGLILISDGRI